MKNQLYRGGRRMDRLSPKMNLTPLIDTAFTILIIFMVMTPMLKKENALQVELPKGKMREVSDTKNQELVVSMNKNGKIHFGKQIMSEKELMSRLQKEARGKKDTVFIKADTMVSYGKVIELVDRIKQIEGFRYVALATDRIA